LWQRSGLAGVLLTFERRVHFTGHEKSLANALPAADGNAAVTSTPYREVARRMNPARFSAYFFRQDDPTAARPAAGGAPEADADHGPAETGR